LRFSSSPQSETAEKAAAAACTKVGTVAPPPRCSR